MSGRYKERYLHLAASARNIVACSSVSWGPRSCSASASFTALVPSLFFLNFFDATITKKLLYVFADEVSQAAPSRRV